jgi:hypothetical protein
MAKSVADVTSTDDTAATATCTASGAYDNEQHKSSDNKLRKHTSDLVDYMHSRGQVSAKQRLFLQSQITR